MSDSDGDYQAKRDFDGESPPAKKKAKKTPAPRDNVGPAKGQLAPPSKLATSAAATATTGPAASSGAIKKYTTEKECEEAIRNYMIRSAWWSLDGET